MKPNPKLLVMLEKVRSAHNVGSVFRTCDAAGVDKLLLCGFCATPNNPKLLKTALGSTKSVNWEHHCNAYEIAKLLKHNHTRLVVVENSPDTTSIFNSKITTDTCLILGHEESGVSKELLALADEVVNIPQFGLKDSLNISVAAGIAIFEYKRKLLIS